MPRIAIIAGEASGDQLGAGLIRAVRERQPDVVFEGVAGPAMVAAGCDAWLDSSELAFMGIFEVLQHLPRLRRLINDLEQRMLRDPPDVFIGIDSPDFNLRLERRLRAAGICTVHYVSPSVWAWRPGRVKVLQAACDMVLCLLPFEAAFLTQRGVPARFVGHPLADEIPDVTDRQAARRAVGLEAGTVVALLPGSRVGEVKRLGPEFADAARLLADQVHGIRFVAAAASEATGKLIRACWALRGPTNDLVLLDGTARQAIAACDAVLVASGTATLEAMLIGRPMVVAYRISPLTLALLKAFRMVRVRYFSLPNLLAGRQLVPEYLQRQASGPVLAGAVRGLLESADGSAALIAEFRGLHDQLRQSANRQAAETVLELVGESA